MTIYTCAHDWEAMLTCIYVAWSDGRGYKNIRLMLEPIEQLTLFDEYIHVEPDYDKAMKVIDSICRKISPYVYQELAYSSMAYEEDILDNIFHVLILGFNFGPQILEMVQYRDVMRNKEIRIRVGREEGYFREFIRFHEIDHSVYVAHIEPKSWIIHALGPQFADRMPSENWMIIDDVHREAVIKPKNEKFYFRKLSPEEYDRLLLTERQNDMYTDMWKLFYDTIAIRQRKNEKCRDNLFPIWTRKHAVEFL